MILFDIQKRVFSTIPTRLPLTLVIYEKTIGYIATPRTAQYPLPEFCFRRFFPRFLKSIITPPTYICHFSFLTITNHNVCFIFFGGYRHIIPGWKND